MKIRLSTEDIEDIVISRNELFYDTDPSGLIFSDFDFHYQGIDANFYEIYLDDISIRYGKGCCSKPLRIDFEDDTELVEMHFNLSGSSLTFVNEINGSHQIDSNEHNLFYCSHIDGHLDWLTKEMDIFEVHLRPSLLEKYLPEGFAFENFYKSMKESALTYFKDHNFPITPQMLLIINEIKDCPLVGNLKKLFIESKVMELLLMQLTQIQEVNEEKSNDFSFDYDQMVFAKEIILSRLENPLSLQELAKVVGTNECFLKKNFKQAFGKTVFGFLNETKMDKAKHLLQREHKTVKEVADMVGYKNPQHFSVAFKKRYGIQPSLLK